MKIDVAGALTKSIANHQPKKISIQYTLLVCFVISETPKDGKKREIKMKIYPQKKI